MAHGTVRMWNSQRGFGFITPDDGSKDLFVHCSAILTAFGERMLDIGQRVTFEPSTDDLGRPRAEKVTVI